jgi:hypothetical protein
MLLCNQRSSQPTHRQKRIVFTMGIVWGDSAVISGDDAAAGRSGYRNLSFVNRSGKSEMTPCTPIETKASMSRGSLTVQT